ncbi:hypothetical protein A6R68_18348, partial [Neotoma lepida]
MSFAKKYKKGLKKMQANNVKAMSVQAGATKALVKLKIRNLPLGKIFRDEERLNSFLQEVAALSADDLAAAHQQ